MQPSSARRSLKQRHLLFGSREFIIKDEDKLLIREKSLLHYQETLLPLNVLQPNPSYATSFAMKWLLLSMFTATLSGLSVYAGLQLPLPVLHIPALIFGGAALITFYRFLLYTTKLIIFRHTISNENYVYLWYNRPGKRSFEPLAQDLMRLIRQNEG